VLSALAPHDDAVVKGVVAEGVSFFDLREEFEAVPDHERRALFQARTLALGAAGHYSPAGNQFVARSIARRLLSLGIVPADHCDAF
jgi:hypothetical protein